MARYCVNKEPQPTGEHKVHAGDCSRRPAEDARIHLGSFLLCWDAMREARVHYLNVDGCEHCCPDCHKR